AFYGRVSTEDWQDPVMSRARQRDQAAALVAGHGRVVAEFFDTGYSRTLPWARRPQGAALAARGGPPGPAPPPGVPRRSERGRGSSARERAAAARILRPWAGRRSAGRRRRGAAP